jgi:hypothetical protein
LFLYFVSFRIRFAAFVFRYFAIKCPLKTRVTHKRGKLVILIVWIISISLASVQLFVARVKSEVEILNETTRLSSASSSSSPSTTPLEAENDAFTTISTQSTGSYNYSNHYTNTKYYCNEDWSSIQAQQIYTLFNFFAVYLIPVFILGTNDLKAHLVVFLFFLF